MKPLRILIAEDDEDLLKILHQVFMDNNFTVYAADNGTSALELYQTCKPDAILMDIDMPGPTGWEVLSRIRKENRIIPIVLMSNQKIEEADMVQSYRLGASSFIAKPLPYQGIVAHIQSAINLAYGTEEVLAFGHFQLNMSSFLLTAGDTAYQLTEREVKMLAFFFHNNNRIVEKLTILHDVWHIDALPNNYQMVRNTIAKLNKILKNHGNLSIESVYAQGYVFKC